MISQAFGRFRQLHTIISHTIKPSSPTPPHLQTHVLTLVDSINPHKYMPFVFFYKNFNHDDIKNLKKSLSQCLTQYYPLAGRFSPSLGHVDCNDEGVEFLEASHDSRLEDFIFKKENESLHQLVPNVSKTSLNMVNVQLNHFTGGGAAIVVSTSHKVADAFTMCKFISQWATIARGGSPASKPYFVTSSTSYNNVKLLDDAYTNINEVKQLTRSFVFPNSKINELKKKVISNGVSAGPPLTRVEVLTSLLFKCAVEAATTKSGFFRPSSLLHSVNMRNKIFKNDPENVAGNILILVNAMMNDSREITLNEVVAKLRKAKMEIKERDMQEIGEKWVKEFAVFGGNPSPQPYFSSSICGFPLYEVDFGWGKPVQVKFVIPNDDNKIIVLTDTPHRDGIEASLHLPEEEMMIVQEDKELLAYVGP